MNNFENNNNNNNEQLEIQRRKNLLSKYNLIYTKRIWDNKIKTVKNSGNYDNNKTELENMKIYLDFEKEFQNYKSTLKRGEYAFHCKIHSFYKGSNSKQHCQKCRQIKINFQEKFYNVFDDFFNSITILDEQNKENIQYKEILVPGTQSQILYYWHCKYCKKWFLKNYKNLNKMFYSFENNEQVFCSHDCANKNTTKERSKPGFCECCGKYSKNGRDSTGKCNECSSIFALERTKRNMGPGECYCCHKIVKNRDLNGYCMECKPYNPTFKIFNEFIYNGNEIPCNENCNDCLSCPFKDNINTKKNIYGWCTKSSNFRKSKGKILKDFILDNNININYKEEKFNIINFENISGIIIYEYKNNNDDNDKDNGKIITIRTNNIYKTLMRIKKLIRSCSNLYIYKDEKNSKEKNYNNNINEKLIENKIENFNITNNNIKFIIIKNGEIIKNINNFNDLKKNIKKENGLIIYNNKIHESKNIIRYIENNKKEIYNINNYNEDENIIKIIINSNNKNKFKLNYKLKINNVTFLNIIDDSCNINNINNNYKIINKDNFDDLINISGVWAIWGFNNKTNENTCLTVGQSINIGKELNWTLKILANEKLQEKEKENPGCTGRWDKIQKYYNNFYYVKVAENIEDFDEREIIEAIYATENNALYWMPSLTQKSIKFLDKLKDYKET